MYVGADHCTVVVGGISFLVVRGDPEPDIFKHIPLWANRMRSNAGEHCGFIVVLRSDTPPPPEPVRARVRQIFKEFGKFVRGGAMVIEGEGFVSATFRSVLSVIILMSRPHYPLKIFSSAGEATEWLVAQLGRGCGVSQLDLLSAINETKRAYAAGTLRADTSL
jgi:hypothetical protein